MHGFVFVLALGAAFLVSSSQAQQPQAGPEINLLAFSNGALIERSSSDYGGSWESVWLLDEDPTVGWSSAKDPKLPIEIVIALPEQSEIRRLEFDTKGVEAPDRAAKDIEVLVSEESATSGYKPLLTAQLQPDADGQLFTPARAGLARYVKLIIKNSHGSRDYAQIMDMRGYGVALTNTPLSNVSGTYDSKSYGKFHVKQEGAQLSGCYEHAGGLFQGGLEAHLMRLTWTEQSGRHGPAVMVASRDGKGFVGFWRGSDGGPWNSGWNLKKIGSQIGECPHWKPRGGSGSVVAASLAKEGRVRLYGINFDTDSDKLRADAKPTLDELAAALKTNAGWKIVVEGHTDSSGTPEKNRDLSNRRTASVKAFLVSAGIAANRLENAGYGQDQPIAPNETSLGRAQNRRVEVVRR